MNNDGNHLLVCMYVVISAIIGLSCESCWKVTVSLISVPILLTCITYTCKRTNAIEYNTQELNVIQHRNLRVIIQTPPDFTRLYTSQTVNSPLHFDTFSCSICLDESNVGVKTLLCGHEFHQICIEEWFVLEESCPLCRDEFDNV